MAAISKLTPAQIALARETWENDERESVPWLIRRLNLPITDKGLRKRIVSEKWKKKRAVDRADPAWPVVPKVPLVPSTPEIRDIPKVSKVPKSAKVPESESDSSLDVASEKIKRKVGRPTSYREEYADMAYRLCLIGYTNFDLKEFFHVNEETIYNWLDSKEDFSKAVRKGRDIADGVIAESLYERAKGYSHEETKLNVIDNEIVETVVTKRYPPDTAAASLWLRNRKSKFWKERVETKEEINVNVFPSQELLDSIYQKGLSDAAERERILVGRRERLGIVITQEEDSDD